MQENNNLQVEENLFEKKLPYELKMYIFSFFNQKELKEVSGLSKAFEQLSDETIKQLKIKYIENIFWTTGKPIQYTNNNSGYKARIFSDLAHVYRDEIPLKEIYDSFSGKNVKNLRLFKTENEACEFSRFLRTEIEFPNHDRIDSCQPAIFKVIYLSEIDESKRKQENLIINQGKHYPHYDLSERIIQIEFFEIERIMVIPLEGTLKIHQWNKGDFRTYDSINYEHLNLDKLLEEKDSSKCLIC